VRIDFAGWQLLGEEEGVLVAVCALQTKAHPGTAGVAVSCSPMTHVSDTSAV
jgi:pheromone shutdown protein TraB